MLGLIGLKLKSKWLVKLLIMTGLLSWVTKYFNYSRRTLEEVLEEITDNKDLRAVLAYSFGDYGMHIQWFMSYIYIYSSASGKYSPILDLWSWCYERGLGQFCPYQFSVCINTNILKIHIIIHYNIRLYNMACLSILDIKVLWPIT